jgi:IS66 Orf2 like protein
VIGPSGTVRVMVATRPVDFGKGTESLSALVREIMAADPFSGTVYVFRAKRADRIKLVFWDGTGLSCSPSGSRASRESSRSTAMLGTASSPGATTFDLPSAGPTSGVASMNWQRPGRRRQPVKCISPNSI